jgi:3-hydroxyisobutyrate dehydrogenase/2-hydroxy-3-oxopropionate reductase
MDIGFAGIGRMGRAMVRNLARAGHQVVAYDPRPSNGPDLEAVGVTFADDPVALGRTAVSISMLPDSTAAVALLGGTEGLLATARPGHCHVLMGTTAFSTVLELAAQAESVGCELVDAPVSGSVSMAETATITAMVGARTDTFDRLTELLSCMTRAQFRTGLVGSGTAAKLAVNAVVGALNQATAEAMLLSTRAGIDAEVFYDVLESSAAGAPYVGYKREAFLHPETTAVAAPVSLIRKDLGLALDLATSHGLRMPAVEACAEVLEGAVAAGDGELDMSRVGLEIERRSNGG